LEQRGKSRLVTGKHISGCRELVSDICFVGQSSGYSDFVWSWLTLVVNFLQPKQRLLLSMLILSCTKQIYGNYNYLKACQGVQTEEQSDIQCLQQLQ